MRLIDADELEEKAWRFGLGTREDVVNLIRNAPTVEPKRGHWIVYDEGEGYPNTCECSNCGTFYDEEDAYCYDCCPTCGAKMDEVT